MRYRVPVIIDEKVYHSLSQASKLLNIPLSTISTRCLSDRFPNYKYGDKWKGEFNSDPHKPVLFRHDDDFKSFISRLHKGKRTSDETKSNISEGLKRYSLKRKNAHYERPIRVGDTCYISITVASEILKLGKETIMLRCKTKHKNFIDWELLGENPCPVNKKVSINGVIYNSIREAANTLKMNKETLKRHCLNELFQDWFFVK